MTDRADGSGQGGGPARKLEAALSASRVCPACRTVGPVRIAANEVCAACEAQAAWSKVGQADRLVIDRASIDEAVRRRQGEAAGEPLGRRLAVWLNPAVSLAVAGLASWLAIRLMSARAIGPLGALLADLRSSTVWSLVGGLGAVIIGAVALRRARRARTFRRLAAVASPLVAIIAGATACLLGVAHLGTLGAGAGWQYTAMPPRVPLGLASQVERIVDATVVVLAPDGDGDARATALGTGAVVAADATRAWIVTCSHVAMPDAAVGAWRHARDAQPVWVQLADGREGRAVVRWAAPPPLDVVIVELPIASPPEPVVIASETSDLQPSAHVTFVPNPYRAGWKVLHGELRRREPHRTPAGTYDLLYTDLPVIHGDSGSGLFDAQGRLIGINTWTRVDDGQAQGISLPSETLRVLVDAIRAGKLDQLDEAVRPPARK